MTVSGCSNSTVAGIVQGTFLGNGANHGKPVYKKEGAAGSVSVLIYFWDERDGPGFSGWWFGPKVGGDQVWAYNAHKASPVPPPSGWRVPWDGPEDESLRVILSAGGAGVVPPRDAHQRQQDQERMRREREQAAADQRRQEQERQRQEENRRRHEEEENRKRLEREAEQRRREAEAKKRREEEEQRKRETAAALAVRKVIQRVRIATPETYDNLRAELEECLANKLEEMGAQGNKVSEEAEQTLKQAQKRIDEINEKRAEDERRREEEAKKRKEENEKVEQLLKDAAEQLKTAEATVAEVEEAAKQVPDAKEAAPEAVVEAVDVAAKVYEASQVAVDKVLEWFNTKRQELTDNHASRNNVMEYGDMCNKVEQGKRSVTQASVAGKVARERATCKGAALKKVQERRLFFAQRDKDKDGKLSRGEVMAFSKEIHEFEIPSDVLGKIMTSLEPVTVEKFHRLHQKVAIAKLEAKTRTKRAKLEQERQAFQTIVDEADKLLVAAEGNVGSAEAGAGPLARGVELSSCEMKKMADGAQVQVTQAEQELEAAAEKLTEAEETCSANKDLSFGNKGALRHRQERIQSRLTKVAATVKKALEQAVQKAAVEMDRKFTESVAAIHKHMNSAEKSAEMFYGEFGGGQPLRCEKFIAFLNSIPDLKFDEGEGERLFAHISQGSTTLNKDGFLDATRMYYRCVKSTVLSEEVAIKAKTLRRLEEGEIFEALAGPSSDDSCSVQRVKCRALSDGVTGWVTLQGNQGTPFLAQWGNCISVKAHQEKLAVEKAEKLAAEKAAAEKLAAEKAAADAAEAEKAAVEAAASEENLAGDVPPEGEDADGAPTAS